MRIRLNGQTDEEAVEVDKDGTVAHLRTAIYNKFAYVFRNEHDISLKLGDQLLTNEKLCELDLTQTVVIARRETQTQSKILEGKGTGTTDRDTESNVMTDYPSEDEIDVPYYPSEDEIELLPCAVLRNVESVAKLIPLQDRQRYQTGSFAFRFRVLMNLASTTQVDLHLLNQIHDYLCDFHGNLQPDVGPNGNLHDFGSNGNFQPEFNDDPGFVRRKIEFTYSHKLGCVLVSLKEERLESCPNRLATAFPSRLLQASFHFERPGIQKRLEWSTAVGIEEVYGTAHSVIDNIDSLEEIHREEPWYCNDRRRLIIDEVGDQVKCLDNFHTEDLKLAMDNVRFLREIEAFKEEFCRGIQLAGRTYEFLGCSLSHLLDGRCTLFAVSGPQLPNKSVENVVEWMMKSDDFLKLSSMPLKLAIRISQLLGVTYPTVAVQAVPRTDTPLLTPGAVPQYSVIDDVTTDNKTMTDGCGLVSEALAEKIAQTLPTAIFPFIKTTGPQKYIPSAYQIRIGGCKGMVVVSKDLGHEQICVRHSMVKFTATDAEEHRKIEVVNVSGPSPPATTSSVLLHLLLGIGVTPDTLINLATDFWKNRCAQLLDDQKYAMASAWGRGDCIGFSIAGCCRSQLIGAFLARFWPKAVRKFNIEIPESRRLFGVADPSNLLSEDEIYVQLADGTSLANKQVLVTKEPCLFPGDVRKLRVKDVEGLRHLKDVIVFSTRGSRPVPDMIAGSDLDGDVYFITWENQLVNEAQVYEPSNFPTAANPYKRTKAPGDSLGWYLARHFLKFQAYPYSLKEVSTAFSALQDKLGPAWIEELLMDALARTINEIVDAPKQGHQPESSHVLSLLRNHQTKLPDYMLDHPGKSLLHNHTSTLSFIFWEVFEKSLAENSGGKLTRSTHIPRCKSVDDGLRYLTNILSTLCYNEQNPSEFFLKLCQSMDKIHNEIARRMKNRADSVLVQEVIWKRFWPVFIYQSIASTEALRIVHATRSFSRFKPPSFDDDIPTVLVIEELPSDLTLSLEQHKRATSPGLEVYEVKDQTVIKQFILWWASTYGKQLARKHNVNGFSGLHLDDSEAESDGTENYDSDDDEPGTSDVESGTSDVESSEEVEL